MPESVWIAAILRSGSDDMRQLAEWIHEAIVQRDNPEALEGIHQTVIGLAQQHPLP